MPIHNLDKLFYPCSVAVVGATNRDHEPGNFVMHNLLQGGFEGPIMPVTDREQAIAGVLTRGSMRCRSPPTLPSSAARRQNYPR